MIGADKLNSGVTKGTDIVSSGTNFVQNFIQWVLDLHPYLKLNALLIILFLFFVFWEVNRIIKLEKEQIERVNHLRGA